MNVKVAISKLWSPGHVRRIDTERGIFIEINSPIETSTELITQRALLKAPPSNIDLLWNQKREHSTGQ